MRRGCLSIPGKSGTVARPERVKLKALNRNGEEVTYEGTGLLARAFCHETDHLDGILYIDKSDGNMGRRRVNGQRSPHHLYGNSGICRAAA